MADEVKRTKGGRPRKYASDEKRPTMTFRVRGGMHEKLVASAKARDVSLSEEIERRLTASFDAETLEATLRRVIREEIVADREAQCASILSCAQLFDNGVQRGSSVSNSMAQDVSRLVTMPDALAVTADAQH